MGFMKQFKCDCFRLLDKSNFLCENGRTVKMEGLMFVINFIY